MNTRSAGTEIAAPSPPPPPPPSPAPPGPPPPPPRLQSPPPPPEDELSDALDRIARIEGELNHDLQRVVERKMNHSSLFKKGVEKLPPRLQEEVKTEPLVVLAICLGVLALLCCGVCCVCCRYRARIRRAAKRRAAAKAERRLDQEVLNPNGASYDEGYQL